MRRCSTLIVLGIVAAMALGLTACSPSGPAWVDKGRSFTPKSITTLFAQVDISKLVGTSSTDTSQQRHDALTGLRRRGGGASEAADLITKTLPPDIHGVPVYVEKATFEGKPAIIIVEAIGPPKGSITTKRIWVLSSDGTVLYVGTR